MNQQFRYKRISKPFKENNEYILLDEAYRTRLDFVNIVFDLLFGSMVQKTNLVEKLNSMPQIAPRFSNSDIVRCPDNIEIKDGDELKRFKDVMVLFIEESDDMANYDYDVNILNNNIKTALYKNPQVYRALHIQELYNIVENNGKVGMTGDRSYAIKDDFVSTSLSSRSARSFISSDFDIMVKFDLSNLQKSEYKPVKYEVRQDVKISNKKINMNTPFRPYEYFGGTHSINFASELEIHIAQGSIPKITEVYITYNAFMHDNMIVEQIKDIVKCLDKIQGNDIIIRPFFNNGLEQDLDHAWQSNGQDKQEFYDRVSDYKKGDKHYTPFKFP